jgi:hypothetical protein
MHHKGTLHSERGYLNGLIDVNRRSHALKFRFLLEPRLFRRNFEFDRNSLAASPAQFSPFLRVFLGLDPVLYGKSAGLDGLLERMVISVGTREARERSVGGVALAEVAGQHRGAG